MLDHQRARQSSAVCLADCEALVHVIQPTSDAIIDWPRFAACHRDSLVWADGIQRSNKNREQTWASQGHQGCINDGLSNVGHHLDTKDLHATLSSLSYAVLCSGGASQMTVNNMLIQCEASPRDTSWLTE